MLASGVLITTYMFRLTRKIGFFLAPAESCTLQLQRWGPSGRILCFLVRKKILLKKKFLVEKKCLAKKLFMANKLFLAVGS